MNAAGDSQEKNRVTGTLRTNTGDYRYLEGIVDGDSLRLSTFDGAHAFLFTAKVTDSSLSGTFYSGNHFKEPVLLIKAAWGGHSLYKNFRPPSAGAPPISSSE